MVKYPKHGLRMAELWLDSPIAKPEGCDLLLLRQYTEVPACAIRWPFSTLTIDLDATEESLLEGLNRETRYQVKRALPKAPIECIHEPAASDEVCCAFHDFYERFSSAKGLDGLPLHELMARARAGALHFSRAVLNDTTLIWHVHVVTEARVALLFSASQITHTEDSTARATIGRANRLLHWSDILAFKAEGKTTYDFGGWYAGSEDEALLRINQFKQGFGGKRTDQFNAGLALSWRGWVYLRLRQHFAASQRKAMKKKLAALLSPQSQQAPTPAIDTKPTNRTGTDMRQAIKRLLRPIREWMGYFALDRNNYTGPNGCIHTGASFIAWNQIDGDYLEFGVFRGASFSAAFLAIERQRKFVTGEMPPSEAFSNWLAAKPRFFAFDSFAGLPPGEAARQVDYEPGAFACSEQEFRANVAADGVDMRRVVTVPGMYDQSLTPAAKSRHKLSKAAMVFIDCDLYESTVPVLEFITDLVGQGTIIVFHDWFRFKGSPDQGEQRACREWLKRNPQLELIEYWREGPQAMAFLVNIKTAQLGSGPDRA